MRSAIFALVALLVAANALAESREELAADELNPLARILVVPLQSTWSLGVGPEKKTIYSLAIQPIVPLPIASRFSLIFRPSIAIIDTPGVAPGAEAETGIADFRTQLLLSPERKIAGFILGVGADLLFPTATSDQFSLRRWAAGPAAAAFRQIGPWTYGVLVTQDWSYAGDTKREHVDNAVFLGFFSYRLPTGLSFALRPTAIASWQNEDRWTVPLDFEIRQVLRIGPQALSVGVGGGYFVEKPRFEADWRARFILTFLFPR